MMYELRANHRPLTKPMGTETLSRHRTHAAAVRAQEKVERKLVRTYGPGAHLPPRVIVRVVKFSKGTGHTSIAYGEGNL